MGQWLLLLALGIVLQHLEPAPDAGFGEVGISIGAVGIGHTAVGGFKILRHLYKMELIVLGILPQQFIVGSGVLAFWASPLGSTDSI